MIDGGFAKGRETFRVTEKELTALEPQEWALLQRIISEPITIPGTSLSCWYDKTQSGEVLQINLERDVPCITTLGNTAEVSPDIAESVYGEAHEADGTQTFYYDYDDIGRYYRDWGGQTFTFPYGNMFNGTI